MTTNKLQSYAALCEYVDSLNCLNEYFSEIIDPADIEAGKVHDIDSLQELVTEYFALDFPYYDDAMQYLCKNDGSLMTSLALAREKFYGCASVDSSTLAGLLIEQINRDIWSDNEAAISRYLEECIY